jgi:hypothetical protein
MNVERWIPILDYLLNLPKDILLPVLSPNFSNALQMIIENKDIHDVFRQILHSAGSKYKNLNEINKALEEAGVLAEKMEQEVHKGEIKDLEV